MRTTHYRTKSVGLSHAINAPGAHRDSSQRQCHPTTGSDHNLAGATLHNVNLESVCVTNANTRGMTINGVAVHDLLHPGRDHPGKFAQVMPVLKVADIQRSIDWYTGVVGMTLLWRKPQDGGESCMLRPRCARAPAVRQGG
jgi:hypothetical protein